MLLLLLLVVGMIILLIVKPKRSRAPVEVSPPDGSDPIGNLGKTGPQPTEPEPGPEVVVPNGVKPAPPVRRRSVQAIQP